MSDKVRVIVEGPISDYEAFSTAVKRTVEHVQANEPGVLTYECFADEDHTWGMWHDIYDSADAFVAHIEMMQSEGYLDELLSCWQIESVRSFGRVEDERVKAIAEQFGATAFHGVAGFNR